MFVGLGKEDQIVSTPAFSQAWFWENMDEIVNAGKGGRNPNASWSKFIGEAQAAYDAGLADLAKRKGAVAAPKNDDSWTDETRTAKVAEVKDDYIRNNTVNLAGKSPTDFFKWLQKLPMAERQMFILKASEQENIVGWKDMYKGFADERFGDWNKYPGSTDSKNPDRKANAVVGMSTLDPSGKFTASRVGRTDLSIADHGSYGEQLLGRGEGIADNSAATFRDLLFDPTRPGKNILLPGVPSPSWDAYSLRGQTFRTTSEGIENFLTKFSDPNGRYQRQAANGTRTFYPKFDAKESRNGATLVDTAGSVTYERDLQKIAELETRIKGVASQHRGAGSRTRATGGVVRPGKPAGANGGTAGTGNPVSSPVLGDGPASRSGVRSKTGLSGSIAGKNGPATPKKITSIGGTAGDGNKGTRGGVPRTSGGNGNSQPSSATGRKKPGIAPKSTSDSESRGTLPQEEVSLLIDPFRVDAISNLIAASAPPANYDFYLDEFLQVIPKNRSLSRARPIA